MKYTNAVLLQAIEDNPDLDSNMLERIFKSYFSEAKKHLSSGKVPGVVLTRMFSFELSLGKLKYKAIDLTKYIIDEDLPRLNKRFYVNSYDEARLLLSETIGIYKMRKQYQLETTKAQRRNGKR